MDFVSILYLETTKFGDTGPSTRDDVVLDRIGPDMRIIHGLTRSVTSVLRSEVVLPRETHLKTDTPSTTSLCREKCFYYIQTGSITVWYMVPFYESH